MRKPLSLKLKRTLKENANKFDCFHLIAHDVPVSLFYVSAKMCEITNINEHLDIL